jgi:hypothetical protein
MKKNYFSLLLITACGFVQQSNAAIVYNDIADQTLASGGNLTIDFNSDGTTEFTFLDMGFGGTVKPAVIFGNPNFHLTTVSTAQWDVMKGITAGTLINANVGFYDLGDAHIDPFWGTTPFPTVDTYLGAQFKIGANSYFGWILVNWNGNGTFIVKAFAYENVASTAIIAGNTGEQSASITKELKSEFSVFPNPTSDFLEIQSNEIEFDQIEIISLKGDILLKQEILTSSRIDVSSLPNGFYFLQLSNSNLTVSRKFEKK